MRKCLVFSKKDFGFFVFVFFFLNLFIKSQNSKGPFHVGGASREKAKFVAPSL